MQKTGSIATLVLVLMFTLAGIASAGETLGTVQAINPTTKEVLLDNGSTLAVDQNTKIMVEGKQGNLEDLKAGDQVRASFQEKDGRNVATTLNVGENAQGTMGSQGGSSYQGGQSGMGSQGGSSYGSQGSSTSGGQKQ